MSLLFGSLTNLILIGQSVSFFVFYSKMKNCSKNVIYFIWFLHFI